MYRPKASRLPGQPNAPQSKHPSAPPVYRPLSARGALQTKMVSPKQSSPASQPKHSPVAPPIYRPSPTKIAQPKMAGINPLGQPTRTTPKAPPAYHPQPAPKVLQTKKAMQPQLATGEGAKRATCVPTNAYAQSLAIEAGERADSATTARSTDCESGPSQTNTWSTAAGSWPYKVATAAHDSDGSREDPGSYL